MSFRFAVSLCCRSLLLMWGLSSLAASGAGAPPSTWRTGGADHAQTYYSPLAQIDRNSVDDLGFAWEYLIDTTHGFEATPVFYRGVLYASGPKGAVYAVDARSGRERWTFHPTLRDGALRKVCCGIVNRGVAVEAGRVFVGSVDGTLYALDADDGSVLWRVDTITDHSRGYTITGAPYIADGRVVIGNSGAELDARGYITAYDLESGEQAWRFFTVPASAEGPHEHEELAVAAETWDPDSRWDVGLGGTVWDGMAYDPDLNLLYVGTGNGTPYARKLRSPAGGDNLYLSTILALHADSGELAWHYQTTPADNWDFTATQKMILATVEIDGRARDVLMQAPKNGFFYVLDRETGELLSAEPYVPVNWASHVDPDSGRPVETGQGEYFDRATYVEPSPAGGHNWQPMAYNPGSGLVYIPTLHGGAVWAMPEGNFQYNRGGFNMAAVYAMPSPGAWGYDGQPARLIPNMREVVARQERDTTIRGYLKAWDPVRQQVVWQVESSGPWEGDAFALWNGGGVMTTAGGLVFQGRATGHLLAFDARTGEKLRQLYVGTSMMAAPMSYKVDGEQYVAVMAGLGGAMGQVLPPGTAAYERGNRGRLLAFKLGGEAVPLPPRVQQGAHRLPRPPVSRRGSEAQQALGEELFVTHCAKCHTNQDAGAGGIPDLRRMSSEVHGQFNDILLRGTRASRGMGSFADLLSPDEVEAVHSYLIDLAWSTWESENPGAQPHKGSAVEP